MATTQIPQSERSVEDHRLHTPKTTRGNIITVLIAGWGSFMFGYSNNVVTGTLALPSFNAKFLNDSNSDSTISGIIGGLVSSTFLPFLPTVTQSAWKLSLIQPQVSGRSICRLHHSSSYILEIWKAHVQRISCCPVGCCRRPPGWKCSYCHVHYRQNRKSVV